MKKAIIGVLVLLAIGLGYYLISPLFRNIKVDEAVPVGDVASTVAEISTAPAPLVGTPGHSAEGTARIVTVGGKNYVRYENFKTINGPDLFIYLSKDLVAKESVNIGRLKATEGNVNYEIPADINPKDYPYVLVWCRAFSVLFNSAKVY